MTAVRHLEDRHGWQGALVAAILNGVGMPLDLLIGHQIPHMPLWAPLGSSAVGVVLIVVLFARRRDPTARFNSTVFVLNIAAIIGALWFTSSAWAAASPRWIPFQANKLGLLASAILAPTLVSGAVSIGAFLGMVLLKYATFPEAIQHRFPAGEPWTILIYGLFGLALLVYRQHGLVLERRMQRLRFETAATERLARTFLAVRDFTNTPLQTIELAAVAIRRKHPDLGPILDRIERSVDRLFRLNHTFSAYESHIKWKSSDVSLDAASLIRRGQDLERARGLDDDEDQDEDDDVTHGETSTHST